jgi:predicted metal-binding protein
MRSSSGGVPSWTGKYVALARAGGAAVAKVIPAQKVVTAEWVRLKCQFGCSGFGKRLSCPPRTPTPETTRRMLAEYRWALLFVFDGPRERRQRRRLQEQLAMLERTAFLDGHYKAFGLGAGPCRLCVECDVTRRCRHPEHSRPSMESCGIDVYATCRNAGVRLEVVTCRTDQPRYVHLLLLD